MRRFLAFLLLVLLALVLLGPSAHAQDFRVTGSAPLDQTLTVHDQHGHAVEAVDVEVATADTTIHGLTGADGTFTFAVDTTTLSSSSPPAKPPHRLHVRSPYPRPNTGTFTIPLSTDMPGEVCFTSFDLLGRAVYAQCSDGALPAGEHDVHVNHPPVADGIYPYRITHSGRARTGQTIITGGTAGQDLQTTTLRRRHPGPAPRLLAAATEATVRLAKEGYPDTTHTTELPSEHPLELLLRRLPVPDTTHVQARVVNIMNHHAQMNTGYVEVDGDKHYPDSTGTFNFKIINTNTAQVRYQNETDRFPVSNMFQAWREMEVGKEYGPQQLATYFFNNEPRTATFDTANTNTIHTLIFASEHYQSDRNDKRNKPEEGFNYELYFESQTPGPYWEETPIPSTAENHHTF